MLHKVKVVTAKGTGKKAINRQDESHVHTEAALKRWKPALSSLLSTVASNEHAWTLVFQSYSNLQTSAEAIYSKNDHHARSCLRALQDGRASVNPGPPDSAGVALKQIAQAKHDIKALLTRITHAEAIHEKRFEASREHTYYKGKTENIAQKGTKNAKQDGGRSNKSHKSLDDFANELNKLTAQLYAEMEEIDRERLRVTDRAVCAVVKLQDFYYSSNPARSTKEKCQQINMGARAIPRDEAKSWLQLQPPNVSGSSITAPQAQTAQQVTPSPTVQHPYPGQAFSASAGNTGYLQPSIQHAPSASSISSAPGMSSISSVPSPMQHSGHTSPVSLSHLYSPNGYPVTSVSQGYSLPPTQQMSPGSSGILTPPAVPQNAAQPHYTRQQSAPLQTATLNLAPLQKPAQPQYFRQQSAPLQIITQSSAPLQQPAQPATPLGQIPQASMQPQYATRPYALVQNGTHPSSYATPPYAPQPSAIPQPTPQPSTPYQPLGQDAAPLHSMAQPPTQYQHSGPASAQLQQPTGPSVSLGRPAQQPVLPQHPVPIGTPTHTGHPVQPSNPPPPPAQSTAPSPQPSQWPVSPGHPLRSPAPPQQHGQQPAHSGKPLPPSTPHQLPQPPALPGYPTPTSGPAQHPTRISGKPMYPPKAYSAGFNPAVPGYWQPPVPSTAPSSATQPFSAQSPMPPTRPPAAPLPPQPQYFMQPRPPSM